MSFHCWASHGAAMMWHMLSSWLIGRPIKYENMLMLDCLKWKGCDILLINLVLNVTK